MNASTNTLEPLARLLSSMTADRARSLSPDGLSSREQELMRHQATMQGMSLDGYLDQMRRKQADLDRWSGGLNPNDAMNWRMRPEDRVQATPKEAAAEADRQDAVDQRERDRADWFSEQARTSGSAVNPGDASPRIRGPSTVSVTDVSVSPARTGRGATQFLSKVLPSLMPTRTGIVRG